VSLCHLRAPQQPPNRLRRRPRRAPPRVRATSSATILETPDTAVGRACHRSRDEGAQHVRRSAGKNGTQPLGRGRAPSNVVRSQSAPRSTQLSPPPTPAEALARAQLLLDFPPAAEKLDEWRATIRSLVGVANQDEPRPAGPSGRHSVEPPHASGGRTGGAAATVHSPPPRQLPRVPVRRDDACDNISIASSDPRTHRDQRQVLQERASRGEWRGFVACVFGRPWECGQAMAGAG